MTKPQIIIEFHDDTVDWFSVGWKNDAKLMEKAKKAINDGNTPQEVIANLSKTFTVIQGA
jgi:adenylate kinase family enzyme